jgi:hypothetical protein
VFSETRNLHSAKGYFKRLTKENTKQIGRQLAKHTHSSALVVFDYILSQIEVSNNKHIAQVTILIVMDVLCSGTRHMII